MDLFNKIRVIYPEITVSDTVAPTDYISLRDDLDERGEYIERWEHPVYPEPTQERLDAVPEDAVVLSPRSQEPIEDRLVALGIPLDELKAALEAA